MAGKALVNTKFRYVTGKRLLWNRCTPTRNSWKVAKQIANSCSESNINISVGYSVLYIVTGNISYELKFSKPYARCLSKAGVLGVEFEKGTTAKEIKIILNALSDRKLKSAKRILEAYSFTMEFAYVESGVRGEIVSRSYQLRRAKDPSLPAKEVADLINRYLPKSHKKVFKNAIPDSIEDQEVSADSTGNWMTTIQVPIEGTPGVYEYFYAEKDFIQAAHIINKHPKEKRESILAELAKLNPELSKGIEPFVEL